MPLSGPITGLVFRSVENHQALFLSGGQSTLAGMCFIRRLSQECCSNGRQFRNSRRKLCLTDAIVESGEIEVSFIRVILYHFSFFAHSLTRNIFDFPLSTASFSFSVK